MSRIGSSSGVRIAAQPLSNIYTVFLMLGLLMPLAYVFGTLLMGRIEPLELADGFNSRK